LRSVLWSDDDPFWAIVGRDNISIFLKAIAPDIKPVPIITHEWARWGCIYFCCRPDALFEEYNSRGVTFINLSVTTMMACAVLKLKMQMAIFYFLEDQSCNDYSKFLLLLAAIQSAVQVSDTTKAS
jgi:hypothetical protein